MDESTIRWLVLAVLLAVSFRVTQLYLRKVGKCPTCGKWRD